jgi:single-strand DNA-binding protein
MSRSLNKALLIGNLGADPEVRTTSNGTRVAQFSLATNRMWTDAQGERQERTEWHRVVVWGKLVEVVEQYLRKGDRVYVEGEIQYRSYEDAEGITRHTTEIHLRHLIMLGGRDTPSSAPEPTPARGRQDRSHSPRRGTSYENFQAPPVGEPDDDLPF